MARTELFIEWIGDGNVYDENEGETYTFYEGTLFIFDSLTLAISTQANRQLVYLSPVADTPPSDFSYDTNIVLASTVVGGTQMNYYHNGTGGIDIIPQVVAATATVIGCDCWGTDAGIVDLTVASTSPRGSYTYLWSDGVTTPDRTQMRAGNYTVLIRHESGAQLLLPVTVGQKPRLEVIIDKTDLLVTLRVSGGQSPYTYAWSDGPTTSTRSNLTDGTYQCTITDALGCTTQVQVSAAQYRYYFVRNPISLALDAGNGYRDDPSTAPGLTFVCQVLVERVYKSGVFEVVGTELEQPADREGRTTFQVQELLAPELDYHVPPPTGSVAERATALFRRFYLRHAQVAGEPPLRGASTNLVQHYAVLGGLSFTEARARTWFNSYQPGVKPFLTWEPNDKAVFADQPEFLYFQTTSTTAELYCRLWVDFADGTRRGITLYSLEDVSRFEVFCFGVGLPCFANFLTPGQAAQVAGWQVEVLDGEGVIVSEKRRYVLDGRLLPLRRYLLYANSLGGMNTFVLTGEAQYEAQISGDQIELTRPLDYDVLAGDTAVLERELRPVLKLASGLRLGSAAMLGLQELLLSRRVLLFNTGRWLAGYLKTKTVNLLDDGKLVPTLEVEFVLPTEHQFTPYLPPTPAGTVPLAVGPESGRL